MEAVTVNPRVVADALGIEVWDLQEHMRTWAVQELRALADNFDHDSALLRRDDPLDEFDARVERARRDLAGAVACAAAWNEDNPADPDEN